jgi:hypothetical protein
VANHSRNNKIPGRCIFCGGFGLSKEHVFGEWIQALIPTNFSKARHYPTFYVRVPGFGEVARFSQRGKFDQPGDPLTRRLRIVCKKCNNEWMSQLQENSIRILRPLIMGDWQPIVEADQEILAAWIAMTTMVIDFADLRTQAVSLADRTILYRSHAAPSSWHIWIGRSVGGQHGAFWHTGFGIYTKEQPLPLISLPKCNIQITTFTIGQLVCHSYSNDSLFPVKFSPNFEDFHKIYKVSPHCGALQIIDRLSLNDDDVFQLATDIRTALHGYMP